MKLLTLVVVALIVMAAPTLAQEGVLSPQDLSMEPAGVGEEPDPPTGPMDDLSSPVQLMLFMTALAILPAVLMTVTSFTRIIVVLSFVRRALSIQDVPPNQVMIGISLFLTIITMRPVFDGIWNDAVSPYMDGTITIGEAGEVATDRLGSYLRENTGDEEIALFLDLAEVPEIETEDEVPITVLVPAFALSELKVAFKMGFLVYVPFLIVDIVIASILLAMGMFMLPPVIISTPFKILLFIMVDGWSLVIGSLVQSFQMPPI